ncbi:hypothetical protein FALCPG4_006172 [Fusarium falciforme]
MAEFSFCTLKLPCGIFRAYCFAIRLKVSFSHRRAETLPPRNILVRLWETQRSLLTRAMPVKERTDGTRRNSDNLGERGEESKH